MPDKPFVVDGSKLQALIGDAETAQVKYIRLFSAPDNPRTIDTLVEFMARVSDWTEYELGELTVKELMDLFGSVREAVESEAVDPTPSAPSSSTPSEETIPSPDGAKSSRRRKSGA